MKHLWIAVLVMLLISNVTVGLVYSSRAVAEESRFRRAASLNILSSDLYEDAIDTYLRSVEQQDKATQVFLDAAQVHIDYALLYLETISSGCGDKLPAFRAVVEQM